MVNDESDDIGSISSISGSEHFGVRPNAVKLSQSGSVMVSKPKGQVRLDFHND